MKLYLRFCLLLSVYGYAFSEEEIFYSLKTIMDYSWRLSEASNQFGFNLLEELVNQKPGNVLFSPISVSITFGLIYLGAKGTTEKELENILEYKSVNLTKAAVCGAFRNLLTDYLITVHPSAYVLDLANAIFVNSNLGLKPTFKTEAEKFFRSPVEAVDFSYGGLKTVNRINEFVRNKTANKICSIVDYLDPAVDLIAVNALYFKSKWNTCFAEKNTKNGTFYNAGKTRAVVPMMLQEDYFVYNEDENLRMVSLGFWGRNISMLVLLPRKMNGLLELEKSITHEKLSHLIDTTFPKSLRFLMPKFKLSYANNLGASLQSMGGEEIFQPSKANLTGMVEEERIAVGEVLHKAVIDVNEQGVEASGVTAVLSFKSMPLYDEDSDVFAVDHPFLFVILDERTNLVLLMGRVWNL